jgi:hypothetical protein
MDWKDNGEYDYLTEDLTRGLIGGLKLATYRYEKIKFIEPSILLNIDLSDYSKYVDIYLDARILRVTVNEKKEKRNSENIYIRTITVEVEYEYIRSSNHEVISRSKVNLYKIRESEFTGHIITDIINNIILSPSDRSLAKRAVESIRDKIYKDFMAKTIREKRTIINNSNISPSFNEAVNLVKHKKYYDALIIFYNIYKQTSNINAGYNAVILLQANYQFTEALELAIELENNIAVNRLSSRFNIKREIENINKIIHEL